MKAIRTKEVNENVKAANSCLRKAKRQAKELFVMILYFNDYKLIYIITMMGKINNIPVLNEDVIRLVVLNEEIIGYIYPRRTSYVVALEIKPGRTTSLATSVNKQCMVLLSDKVRLATEQDFDDFHICFDGFRNNTMYCYNQGTEPIYLQ